MHLISPSPNLTEDKTGKCHACHCTMQKYQWHQLLQSSGKNVGKDEKINKSKTLLT